MDWKKGLCGCVGILVLTILFLWPFIRVGIDTAAANRSLEHPWITIEAADHKLVKITSEPKEPLVGKIKIVDWSNPFRLAASDPNSSYMATEYAFISQNHGEFILKPGDYTLFFVRDDADEGRSNHVWHLIVAP